MNRLRRHNVVANGIRIHCAEAGEGPMILLVHGFPESWYSWRHQLPALAEAGYRAVAIDVRGYGRSSAPTPVDAYRMWNHVGDNVGVLDALGAETAVVVGHDWGAPIAYHSALARPDRFRAVAGLSVPYTPPGGRRPLEAFRAMASSDHWFYIDYYQEPGRAEAETEPDVAAWLLGFYYSASGEGALTAEGGGIAMVPRHGRQRDRFQYPPEGTLPGWLSQDDLAFYAGEFERTGFGGGLNRYRNVDRDWEDFAAFAHRPIEVPALYVGGSKDGPTVWGRRSIERFGDTLPRLHRSVILDGCGHWTQQERPGEVNELLLEFLRALDG